MGPSGSVIHGEIVSARDESDSGSHYIKKDSARNTP